MTEARGAQGVVLYSLLYFGQALETVLNTTNQAELIMYNDLYTLSFIR